MADVIITQENMATYLSKKVGSLTRRMYPSNCAATLDPYFGPFDSKDTAYEFLKAVVMFPKNISQGTTVGVVENGELKEYQFKKAKPAAGYTVDDLEEKGGSTPVDLKELTVGDTIKSFGTIFLYDGKVTHHRAVYHTTDSNDAWDVAIHPTTGSYNNNHETIFCCEHDAEEDGYESGYRYYIFDNAGMKLIGIVDDSGEDSEVTNGVPHYIRVAFGENLQDEVDALKSDKAPYPSSKTDGKQYVMKNGVWVEVDIKTDADGISYTKDAEGNTDGTVGKALDSLASGKAAAVHSHSLSDVTDIEAKLAEASASAATATAKAGEASGSASAASTSESNAATSEINAKASEDNAKESEDNAATSESNAATSESNAAASATLAGTRANNAYNSADAARQSAELAEQKLAAFQTAIGSITSTTEEGETEVDLTNLAAQVAANAANIADEAKLVGVDNVEDFSDAKQYEKNDLVLYQGMLYRFTTVHPVGAWIGTDAVGTSIYQELEAMRNNETEKLVISFGTSDNNADANLSGIVLTYTIKNPDGTTDHTETRTTDNLGVCTPVYVDYGKMCVVEYGTPPTGYMELSSDTFVAMKGYRNVKKTWRSLSEPAESEAVTVTMTSVYFAGTGIIKTIDGVSEQILFDSTRKITFSVEIGKQYSVKPIQLTGYISSAQTNAIASSPVRGIYIHYIGLESGFKWIMNTKDGVNAERSVDVENLNSDDVLGLWCTSDKLTQNNNNATFVIPVAYLLTTGVPSVSWGDQVDVSCLKNVTSAAAALTANAEGSGYSNGISGEDNTAKALLENAAGLKAMSYCRSITRDVGGDTKPCFSGSYAQMIFLANNYTKINAIVNKAFGKNVKFNVGSGNWWTSSEVNATYAVVVSNGSFGSGNKANNYSVLPLLAY